MSRSRNRANRFVGLFLLVCALPALALCKPKGELYLSLSLTRGERSRDSNSSTTVITINQNTVVYDKTFRGRQPRGRQPIHKEFQITSQDIENLKQLIKTKGLLKSDSKTYPSEAGVHNYFELAIDLKLDGRASSIKLSGPARSAKIKDEQLYKASDALMQEVYKLLAAQDDEIVYEKPVN